MLFVKIIPCNNIWLVVRKKNTIMVTSFCWVSSLRLAVIFAVSFAAWNEALKLDLNLTRQEIITFLGQPANLGCHATTTLINSSLSYSWTKDNHTVTQSSRVKAFGDVLVVTPEEAAEFGVYQCNITNGVSSILCRISLLQGIDKPDDSTTGCVNVSVLMPVLAVAVLSLLLFIHLVLQSRGRRRRNDTLRSKRSDEISLQNQDHNRVREADAVIEENQLQPIELPANERDQRMPRDEVVEENQLQAIESTANGRIQRMSRDEVVAENQLQPIESTANGRVQRMLRDEVVEDQVTQF